MLLCPCCPCLSISSLGCCLPARWSPRPRRRSVCRLAQSVRRPAAASCSSPPGRWWPPLVSKWWPPLFCLLSFGCPTWPKPLAGRCLPLSRACAVGACRPAHATLSLSCCRTLPSRGCLCLGWTLSSLLLCWGASHCSVGAMGLPLMTVVSTTH